MYALIIIMHLSFYTPCLLYKLIKTTQNHYCKQYIIITKGDKLIEIPIILLHYCKYNFKIT